ncbi:MAG: discoidin domain-containing protein [Actinomycetota bacterium]|nr:discoidin domain-containing protein [Actinomycetota bacterium]
MVPYGPENLLDDERATAWLCHGSAVGQRVVLHLARPVTVTSVGLVPGYDKREDDLDRFPLHRTVTSVRWRVGDTVLEQSIRQPTRALVRSDLPRPVETDVVELEITGTGNDDAEHDYTAVSAVELLAR